MSDEITKVKRSSRKHDTWTVIAKRRKLLKDYKIDNRAFKQKHRLSKMNGINCGNPGCMMCINPRRYGEKTIQELSFEQTEKWSEE